MKALYQDIIKRILEPPKWWDENGTPRYDTFTPDQASDIYAREAVLAKIRCQGCHSEFLVCISSSIMTGDVAHLEKSIKDHRFVYGDPPNFGCCDAGPTMNSETLEVIEFWRRERIDWIRHPELEGKVDQ